LSYPERAGANGHRWPIVRPRSAATRREIERQVLASIFPNEGRCEEDAQ